MRLLINSENELYGIARHCIFSTDLDINEAIKDKLGTLSFD